MTWNEFKEMVEKRLEEEGVDGSIELDYIDIDSSNDIVCVDVDFDTGLTIT